MNASKLTSSSAEARPRETFIEVEFSAGHVAAAIAVPRLPPSGGVPHPTQDLLAGLSAPRPRRALRQLAGDDTRSPWGQTLPSKPHVFPVRVRRVKIPVIDALRRVAKMKAENDVKISPKVSNPGR